MGSLTLSLKTYSKSMKSVENSLEIKRETLNSLNSSFPQKTGKNWRPNTQVLRRPRYKRLLEKVKE